MKYVKDKREVYDGFVLWLSTTGVSNRDLYHAKTFPKSLEIYEKLIGKLLPEFTKEDIIKCLDDSLTMHSIKRFYDRSKLWIKYCQENDLYEPRLTEDDLYSSFLYSVPQADYRHSIASHQRYFSKAELTAMLKNYLKQSDNFIIAAAIVLLWEGMTCEEIVELEIDMCDPANKKCTVGDKTFTLSSDYFAEIIHKAMNQKSYTAMNKKSFQNIGSKYLMRGSSVSRINVPMSVSAIRIRFIESFTKTVGREYLTVQDIQTNGRYWRLYVNELENGKTRFTNEGNIINWYVEKQYDQYKEYIISSMNNQ